MILSAVLFLLMITVIGLSIVAQVYGIVLGFKKSWIAGLAALAVPPFALVVGAAKMFAGKNLLA